VDFEPLAGVTRAQVIIDLADGTRYTYDLNANGAKVGYDGGRDPDMERLALDLGPDTLPEIPRVWRRPQLAFAFPLTVAPLSGGARPVAARVTVARTPPMPADADGRAPWQAEREGR
jgi:hypothetical protein